MRPAQSRAKADGGVAPLGVGGWYEALVLGNMRQRSARMKLTRRLLRADPRDADIGATPVGIASSYSMRRFLPEQPRSCHSRHTTTARHPMMNAVTISFDVIRSKNRANDRISLSPESRSI